MLFGLSVAGFLLGSVLFCYIIPKVFLRKNMYELGRDGNPGAANVFMNCGVAIGMLCLILDILKGTLPVLLAALFLDTHNGVFALVMAAPVLGHAVGMFNGFRGGKCIATTFGVMIGLFPITRIGLLLAGLYILFSTAIKINPNSKRSIITFSLFAVGAAVIMCATGKPSIALGCVAVSAVAIAKHLIIREQKSVPEEITETCDCDNG